MQDYFNHHAKPITKEEGIKVLTECDLNKNGKSDGVKELDCQSIKFFGDLGVAAYHDWSLEIILLNIYG